MVAESLGNTCSAHSVRLGLQFKAAPFLCFYGYTGGVVAIWKVLLMIRKAIKSDCLDLAALSLQVWLQTYATEGMRAQISHYALSTFTESHFQELLNNSLCELWVYIINEHLVGFISVDLKSTFNGEAYGYEVTTLYVSEHFQGQGIGKKLLSEIETQLGAPYWLSTWVNNHQAINFYRNLGFEIVGELNFNLDGELHRNYVFSNASA